MPVSRRDFGLGDRVPATGGNKLKQNLPFLVDAPIFMLFSFRGPFRREAVAKPVHVGILAFWGKNSSFRSVVIPE